MQYPLEGCAEKIESDPIFNGHAMEKPGSKIVLPAAAILAWMLFIRK